MQLLPVSVRDGDTVKHYRIRQLDEGGFFIARRVTFRTLSELVDHYSTDADGLCVNLRKSCSQVGELKVQGFEKQRECSYLLSLITWYCLGGALWTVQLYIMLT